MTAGAWDDARNILCIRLDSMGDVLMCTPAIRAMRQARPRRRLTLLTSGSGAAVAPYIEDVDDVIAYAAPWMKHSKPCAPELDLALVRTLADRRFDAALIFTSYSQSPLPAALLCQLAGVPLRLAHCHENPYQLLTDWLPDPEPARALRHEVQRQLDLVASIGCYSASAGLSFRVPDTDLATVRARLQHDGLDLTRPWVLMHPGASAASRRYPVAHLASVVRALNEQHALPVVLAGGGDDMALVEQIRRLSGVPTHDLCGVPTQGLGDVSTHGLSDVPAHGLSGAPTDGPSAASNHGRSAASTHGLSAESTHGLTAASTCELNGMPATRLHGPPTLGELGAALQLAAVAVLNNSGPGHMAAAIGTPVVSLYALTNPQHTPWQVSSRVLFHDVPCRFCYKSQCPLGHHDCMQKLDPQQVVAAVVSLLQQERRDW